MITANEENLKKILAEKVTLKKVESHIYTVISPEEAGNSFDDMATFYDLVICNRYYNRIMWGYDISKYQTITARALNSSENGWVVDAGCGSLAFTAKTYINYKKRPIVLFDQSIKLLKIAKNRIIKLNGKVPDNMIFLQADALKMPFIPKSFNTLISLNLIHVFDDITNVISSFNNVLGQYGTITISTLIKNNRRTDKYLDVMLQKTSGVSAKTSDQLQEYFTKLNLPVNCDICGNMVFITHGF